MKPKYKFFSNSLYAINGLAEIFKNEKSFRIELAIIVPLLIVGLFLPVSVWEHLILALSLFGILFAECVNSAIERAIDLISPKYHPLAKASKDAGSAAVFISISAAVLAWIVVLYNLVATEFLFKALN